MFLSFSIQNGGILKPAESKEANVVTMCAIRVSFLVWVQSECLILWAHILVAVFYFTFIVLSVPPPPPPPHPFVLSDCYFAFYVSFFINISSTTSPYIGIIILPQEEAWSFHIFTSTLTN